MPLASGIIQGTSAPQVLYLHGDHLNTPRLATAANQQIVWQWQSDAFGNGTPNQDPQGTGQQTVLNLRFPGQYFDGASGLHYNYFSDYDSETGRYVESDPIGLAGGLNIYGYVAANPLSLVDMLGLDPGDLFRTPDDAAIDAARYARKRGNQSIEYRGWVYPAGNCWSYNFIEGELPPADDWQSGMLPPDKLDSSRPPKARKIWHTHPPVGPTMFQENFSGSYDGSVPGDMSTSRNSNIGIYLNTPSGINAYYDYPQNPNNPYRQLPNKEPEACGCQ